MAVEMGVRLAAIPQLLPGPAEETPPEMRSAARYAPRGERRTIRRCPK